MECHSGHFHRTAIRVTEPRWGSRGGGEDEADAGLHDASRMAGPKVSLHFYKALNWLRQKSAMSLGCMVNSSYCCLVINTQRLPRHLKPLSAALLIYAP